MKLYRTPDGLFHGRRGDRRDAVIVEVDANAEGIAKALNTLAAELKGYVPSEVEMQDEFTTVVERQDPPIVDLPANDPLVFDEAWEQFPLARKLHFAALACEDAREAIKPLKVAAVDADELFS